MNKIKQATDRINTYLSGLRYKDTLKYVKGISKNKELVKTLLQVQQSGYYNGVPVSNYELRMYGETESKKGHGFVLYLDASLQSPVGLQIKVLNEF